MGKALAKFSGRQWLDKLKRSRSREKSARKRRISISREYNASRHIVTERYQRAIFIATCTFADLQNEFCILPDFAELFDGSFARWKLYVRDAYDDEKNVAEIALATLHRRLRTRFRDHLMSRKVIHKLPFRRARLLFLGAYSQAR